MNAFLARAAIAGSILVAGAAPAFAAPGDTTTLEVSANVTANCVISTTPLNFGNVDVTTGQEVDGSSKLDVLCTRDTPWSASADGGLNGDMDFVRRMSSNGNLLDYTLTIDEMRQVLWGNGANAISIPISDTGTGTNQTKAIYGRVLGNQRMVPAGTYTDTVTVTVTY